MSGPAIGRVLFITALLLAPATARPPRAQRVPQTPSEVLHHIAKARLENPGWTPNEVEAALKPLLQNVQTRDLSPEEDVALALCYFFTFDGRSAKPIFEKYMDRTDRLGRVSWQSLQQMAFFGAKDYALVEQRTAAFRRQFAPVANDPEYTFHMVNNLARQAAATSDHSLAVSLVLEDLQSLPIGTPFRSFELLALHFPSFSATGKAAIATDWMKRHRDALRQPGGTPAGGVTSPPLALSIPHRAGVLHLTPFADGLYQDDPAATSEIADRMRRAAALAKLDRWIAAAEKGDRVLR